MDCGPGRPAAWVRPDPHVIPMHFLVIDSRFASPVHVFLEQDPGIDKLFPNGLAVRRVRLEPAEAADGGFDAGASVGQSPWQADEYREFRSDRAAAGAGFGLIEPRFIGSSWAAYSRVFRFGAKTVHSRD